MGHPHKLRTVLLQPQKKFIKKFSVIRDMASRIRSLILAIDIIIRGCALHQSKTRSAMGPSTFNQAVAHHVQELANLPSFPFF